MRPNANHFTALAVLAALALASAPVAAQLPAPPRLPAPPGLPAPPPLPDLQVAVHATFGLPEPEIGHLLQGGLPDEDLPVVGFLSVRLGQPVETIVKLHRSGMTFLDIALKFGHGPELFYVPFDADPGPPVRPRLGLLPQDPSGALADDPAARRRRRQPGQPAPVQRLLRRASRPDREAAPRRPPLRRDPPHPGSRDRQARPRREGRARQAASPEGQGPRQGRRSRQGRRPRPRQGWRPRRRGLSPAVAGFRATANAATVPPPPRSGSLAR